MTIAAALAVGGCFFPVDGHGYQVWVTSAWPEPVLVVLEGTPSFEGDSGRKSFRAEPGTVDMPGSFVDIAAGGSGWIEVFDEGCTSLGRFEVDAGDFGVSISSGGDVAIREYGFAQRPSTQETLPPSADCL